MADAYRGLTIKFGGDTTTLQKALKAAASAATSTQKQLKLVEQATQFNPGSLTSVTTQMNLLKNKSQDLATQLKTVKEAISQTSSKTVSFNGVTQTVGELASKTENAALAARNATERYNALNEKLATVYTGINQQSKTVENFGTKWSELAKQVDSAGNILNSNRFDMRDVWGLDDSSFNTVIAELENWGVLVEEDVTKLQELRSVWHNAFDTLDATKSVEGLEQLNVQSESLTAQIGQLSTKMAELRAPTDLASSFTDTNTRIEQIDRSIEELERDIERCDQALQLDPTSVDATCQRMADLEQATKLADEKAELLQQEIEGYSAAGLDKVVQSTDDIETSTEEARQAWVEVRSELSSAEGNLEQLKSDAQKFANLGSEAQEEYEKTAAEISETETKVEQLREAEQKAGDALDQMTDAGQLKNLQEQFEDCKLQAQEFTSAMQTTSALNWSDLKTVGMTLSATVTPALMQAGQSALDAANDIDTAYRDMRKTCDGTDEQFEQLRTAAIEFSQTHVTSADQMLEIEAIGGELGVATGSLETFAETVSNLDIATDLDTEDAATALGQLSNILDDLDQNHMSNFSDALVRLGNNGASTESDIVSIATRIGSMGSIVGMTTPEILALASSVASTGQGAEAAGTAISNTLSDIESAVANGKDKIDEYGNAAGTSLQKFADVAGVSAQDFAATWESNPTQALKSFVEGLKNVEANGGSATATLEDMGITGTRQKQAIEGLMQTIDGLDNNLTMSQDAWDGVSDEWGAAGDAAREADAKAEGLSGTLSKLSNMAQNLGSDIGEAALPYIQELANIVNVATTAFEGMSDGAKTLIVGIGGITAAAGPVLSVIATMGEKIEKLKNGTGIIGSLSSAFKSFRSNLVSSSLLQGVGEGIMTITNSAELGAIAIEGLATAATAGVAALLVIGGSAVISGIQSLVTEYQEAQEHAQLLADATKPIGEIMEEAADGTSDFTLALDDVDADSLLQTCKELNDTIGSTFKELYTNGAMLDTYIDTIKRLGNTGGEISKTDLALLKQAVKGYNDITGDSISVTDEATGALSKSTDSIQKNTDAWKLNAEAQAYSSIYTEALTDQKNAEYELEVATKQQQQAQDDYNKKLEEAEATRKEYVDTTGDGILAQQQYDNIIGDSKEKLDEANKTVSDAQAAVGTLGEKVQWAADNYQEASAKADEANQTLSSSIQELVEGMGDEVAEAFSNTGLSIQDFAAACEQAGISTDTLSSMGAEDFAALVAECDGDINAIIAKLQEYNAQQVDDKNASANSDGNMIDGSAEASVESYQETQVDNKTATADADTSGVETGTEDIDTYNATDPEDKTATADSDSTGVVETTDNINTYNDTDPEDKSATVSINYSSVNDAISAISNYNSIQPENKSATTTITTRNVTINETQSAAGGVFVKHAAGGLFQGRTMYHADGMIVNTATDVTRHIAGEAGAEAIIPLTNRRYTTPFAQTISDLVVSALQSKINELTQRQKKSMESVADKMAGAVDSGNGNADVLAALNQLNANLMAYTQTVANNTPVVEMDGKVVAKVMVKDMNKELGTLQKRGL